MPKVWLWLHYVHSLLLAGRIIVFEKTDTAAALVWTGVTLTVALIAAAYSTPLGLGVAGMMGILFFGFRGWVRRQRYRLIRTADRVEYAEFGSGETDYRQRFVSGVVLQRLGRDDVKRTGGYDAQLMDESKWFFIVKSPKQTKIVPFEWIVAIEIDEGMD